MRGAYNAVLLDGGRVILNQARTETTRRYALAHECGHCHYGHDWRQAHDRECDEYQADRYAAHLLINPIEIEYARAEGMYEGHLGAWSNIEAFPYVADGEKKSGAKKSRALKPEENTGDFQDVRYRVVVLYRSKDGKTRQTEAWGRSRAAAKRKLKAKLPEKVSKIPTMGQSGLSVRKISERWWDDFYQHGKPTEQTKQGYEDVLQRYILPLLGGYALQEITTGPLTSKPRTR